MPTNGKSDKTRQNLTLSQAQCLVIERLAVGATVSAAAEAAGVSRQQVYEWKETQPLFLAQLNAAQAEILNSARAKALQYIAGAFETADEIRRDSKLAPQVRLSACEFLLSKVKFNFAEFGPQSAAAAEVSQREEREELERQRDSDVWRRSFPLVSG
jgi:hypothetical protein